MEAAVAPPRPRTDSEPAAPTTALGSLAIDPKQRKWRPEQEAALAEIVKDFDGNSLWQLVPDGVKHQYLHKCQATELDPFNSEIYLTPAGGGWAIVTGIDGFRISGAKAARVEGARLEYPDPRWADDQGRFHDVWTGGREKPPVGCQVVIVRRYRDGERVPAAFTAYWHEYARTTGSGNLMRSWKQQGLNMLRKCGEAMLWRKMYPERFSGVYEVEELRKEDVEARAERDQAVLDAAAKAAADAFTSPAQDSEHGEQTDGSSVAPTQPTHARGALIAEAARRGIPEAQLRAVTFNRRGKELDDCDGRDLDAMLELVLLRPLTDPDKPNAADGEDGARTPDAQVQPAGEGESGGLRETAPPKAPPAKKATARRRAAKPAASANGEAAE
jgi:hypothetical protein